MELESKIYRNIWGYSLYGFLFGLCFPAIGAFVLIQDGEVNEDKYIEELLANTLFDIILLAPFILALVSFFVARFFLNSVEKGIKEKQILDEIIRINTEFANKIGTGDLEAQPEKILADDVLGRTLLEMRKNLVDADKSESNHNYIVEGVAEVGAILRNNNELKKLGDELVAYITKKLNVIQAAFYVVRNEDSDSRSIEMLSSYAYNKQKRLQASFRFGQGLIGQSAIEQDTIYRTEIPKNYVSITSGILGDKRPSAILIVPLITNEKVYGVLELASFKAFEALHIDFVKSLSDIIARTIFNVNVNERTVVLLNESQKMSNELQLQSEQLLQNAEEMQVTQEELQKSNKKLEIQIQAVEDSQKRTQILLENASEIITIYDSEKRVKYVSPSVTRILGYTPEELTGKMDIDKVHPQGLKNYNQLIQEVIQNPANASTSEYSYFNKKGHDIWLETTAKNFLHDPVINGIVFNSRDISVRRMAEREQRMRGKMQALSENSLDLITRIEANGKCSYINPSIENLTGISPSEYMNKSIYDLALHKSIIMTWQKLIDDIVEHKKKINLEMVFPTIEGEKIMMVNAIPEFNETGAVDSALIVSHDITKAKETEIEIKQKNKNISDSINYAYNIQSSLMPTEKVIQKYLPQSFMFYKPKDVVSGDYPWLYTQGDDIYLAAMDCTGHGVPGALLSLIGFFSQNEILFQHQGLTAGEVLDYLHANIIKNLRQDDPDSKTRDGMDAALCKINLKKMQLHFAGAHRPLYHLSDGLLTEIKADRYPVGGTQYKKRNKFTNTVINLKSGDSVYFTTDGMCDQFGGPEGNNKFMSRRVRELIDDNKTLGIQEMGQVFRKTFEDWRGNQKQFDDILVIGIRF